MGMAVNDVLVGMAGRLLAWAWQLTTCWSAWAWGFGLGMAVNDVLVGMCWSGVGMAWAWQLTTCWSAWAWGFGLGMAVNDVLVGMCWSASVSAWAWHRVSGLASGSKEQVTRQSIAKIGQEQSSPAEVLEEVQNLSNAK